MRVVVAGREKRKSMGKKRSMALRVADAADEARRADHSSRLLTERYSWLGN
jgi:hypothetical protein